MEFINIRKRDEAMKQHVATFRSGFRELWDRAVSRMVGWLVDRVLDADPDHTLEGAVSDILQGRSEAGPALKAKNPSLEHRAEEVPLPGLNRPAPLNRWF